MLVQTPAGTQVTLTLNGATLTLGSTLYLTAARSDQLTVATIEGSAVVSAFDITRVALPGALVRLPLGGSSGLEVTGPPSEPEPFDADAIRRAPLSLLDRPVTVPPPIRPTSPANPTEALGTPFSPQRPTAAPCLPRADWTATYTIQRGDTLFSIARLFNIPVAELQQANCIANPNLIQAGQALRVPFPLDQSVIPTWTPLPTWTPVRLPSAMPAPTFTPLPFDDQPDDQPSITDEPID
ncbi:MAG: LysM peptidoglycan-binding domain-containing protein [Chloroflexi bacterium]|nr:LysM peptidoglycan-binding domain-containing protein [Chloroflexota bacterium]